MRVDPAIAAMRRDRAVLGRAQAAAMDAARAWSDHPRVVPVLADFADYAEGRSLYDCRDLSALFEDCTAARDFVNRFVASQRDVLASEQFAQVPFRHAYDGRMATLLLAQNSGARLSIVSFEPGEYSSGSLVFSDSIRHETVLAGSATGLRTARCMDGTFESDSLPLETGARLTLDLSRHVLFVQRVERRLVWLRLSRDNRDPQPTREFDPRTGALKRQASGSSRQSRQETMLALAA